MNLKSKSRFNLGNKTLCTCAKNAHWFYVDTFIALSTNTHRPWHFFDSYTPTAFFQVSFSFPSVAWRVFWFVFIATCREHCSFQYTCLLFLFPAWQRIPAYGRTILKKSCFSSPLDSVSVGFPWTHLGSLWTKTIK